MDNITVAKRVLPRLTIEAEGNDIIIDVFLRISPIKLEAAIYQIVDFRPEFQHLHRYQA